MFKALAGINPDPEQPGFKHTIIRPNPVPGLAWARAEHAGPYGAIRSEWRVDGGAFTLSVTVPPNTTATVHLPTADADSMRDGGKPVPRGVGNLPVRDGMEDGFVATRQRLGTASPSILFIRSSSLKWRANLR